MDDELARSVTDHGDDPELIAILHDVCALTDMGFAAVARVTDTRWIACQVLDRISFGLSPGDELEVSTTICRDIHNTGRATFIDDVRNDPDWFMHPTPLLYGFQSHASVPVRLDDGSIYGSLCALDSSPKRVKHSAAVALLTEKAARIGAILSQRGAKADQDSGNRSAPA